MTPLSKFQIAAGLAVVLAVLGALTALTWHGAIAGDTAASILMAIVTGGILAGHNAITRAGDAANAAAAGKPESTQQ